MRHPHKELCFIERGFRMPGTSLWLDCKVWPSPVTHPQLSRTISSMCHPGRDNITSSAEVADRKGKTTKQGTIWETLGSCSKAVIPSLMIR